MDKTDQAKAIANLLDKTDSVKKPVKDIKTAILKGLSDEPSNDVRREYAKEIRNIKLIKTAIIIQSNTKHYDINLKTKAADILREIDTLLNNKIETPRPKIYGDGEFKKYTFQDGSDATFENYDQVKNTVIENVLLNQINKISNIYSKGLGLLAQTDKTLWERDDGIEEIDFTGENNNGS